MSVKASSLNFNITVTLLGWWRKRLVGNTFSIKRNIWLVYNEIFLVFQELNYLEYDSRRNHLVPNSILKQNQQKVLGSFKDIISMLKTTTRSFGNQYKGSCHFLNFMVLRFRKREVSKGDCQARVERWLSDKRKICDFSMNYTFFVVHMDSFCSTWPQQGSLDLGRKQSRSL